MFEGLFQPMHLLIIVGLVLLIFGPKNFRNSAKESVKDCVVSERP